MKEKKQIKKFKLTQVIETYQTCQVEAETREDALKIWMDSFDAIGQWINSDCGEVDRIISVDELVPDGKDITSNINKHGEFTD